jgi:hypothetical protein
MAFLSEVHSLLPVDTANCVQTLKAIMTAMMFANLGIVVGMFNVIGWVLGGVYGALPSLAVRPP